jgi:Domain of unknown function (DUF1707)
MLGRMGQKGMRASDRDRQSVVDQLKAALDEGRLDLSEFDDRAQQAYAAKTYGDLDVLLDDLPGTVPVAKSQVVPAEALSPEQSVRKRTKKHPAARSGLQTMGTVFVVCMLVWVMAGPAGYFWPGWLMIPLGWSVLAYLRDRD